MKSVHFGRNSPPWLRTKSEDEYVAYLHMPGIPRQVISHDEALVADVIFVLSSKS